MQNPLFQATAFLAIAIYLALALHVVGQNPRREISWSFAGLCMSVVAYYFTSLFLFPPPGPFPVETPLLLRLKWAAIVFAPVFYFHLDTFYFPARLRKPSRKMLPFIYILGGLFALDALFSDGLLAGPLARTQGEIIGPQLGPLMPALLLFFALLMISGISGLVLGFRRALSGSQRRQIALLFMPALLFLLFSVLNWTIVLTHNTGSIPNELGDSIIIISGFFLAQAVLQFGSLVGYPLTFRRLIYEISGALAVLSVIVPGMLIDQELMASGMVPFPLVTGMIVVTIATLIPVAIRKVIPFLDRLFFRGELRRFRLSEQFVTSLSPGPDPERFLAELISTLMAVTQARGAYLALPGAKTPHHTAVVHTKLGEIAVHKGQIVHVPEGVRADPQLSAVLSPEELAAPGWQDTAVFCLVSHETIQHGLLALAGKKNDQHYTLVDLSVCAALVRQIDAAVSLARLHDQRNEHLEIARRESETISNLESIVLASTLNTLSSMETHKIFIEIRILGSLQVTVNGQPVPETEWGSERAKALLALLIWKGPSGATREEIASMLWPGYDQVRASNVFHVTVNRLRSALEPNLQQVRHSLYVLFERGRYRFNFQSPHWLDKTAFPQLANANDRQDLEKAAALYRGPYLDDAAWSLPSDVEVERRILEQAYTTVLRRLIAMLPVEKSEIYLHKLIVVEPADEQARQALVLQYLKNGRPDLALQQVRRWQAELQQLETSPSPQVQALWQQVESHQPKP